MQTLRIKQLATLSVLIMMLVSVACTTLRPVPVDPAGTDIRAEIHPGDTVQVSLLNGEVRRLKVSQVGTNIISGEAEGTRSQIDVAYAEIRSLEVVRGSSTKNTWLIVAGVAVAIAIAAAVATGGGQHSPGFSR